MNKTFDIIEEPNGDEYRLLVDYLANACSSFSLVWRDQHSFDDRAEALEKSLAPSLISEEHTDEWPGTKLLGHEAWVRYYRLEDGSIALLKDSPSLYAWIGPSRPEDLAFYDSSGECILDSIAHERDSWLCGDEALLREILAGVSGLRVAT